MFTHRTGARVVQIDPNAPLHLAPRIGHPAAAEALVTWRIFQETAVSDHLRILDGCGTACCVTCALLKEQRRAVAHKQKDHTDENKKVRVSFLNTIRIVEISFKITTSEISKLVLVPPHGNPKSARHINMHTQTNVDT